MNASEKHPLLSDFFVNFTTAPLISTPPPPTFCQFKQKSHHHTPNVR